MLTQEQHQMCILQELVRADGREQLERIVYSIRPGIFFQILEEGPSTKRFHGSITPLPT